jgi:hypothetical protein
MTDNELRATPLPEGAGSDDAPRVDVSQASSPVSPSAGDKMASQVSPADLSEGAAR